MDAREQKGLEIASSMKLAQRNGRWFVPSQSGGSKYAVEYSPDAPRCTCPDYELRRVKCKHIFAVQYSIQRDQIDYGETQIITETETLKVTRKTYTQVWPAYNKAQTQEKAQFQYLLHKLCEGIGEPGQVKGRPRLPLEDMIFAMAFKVYSTVSGRRFMTDLREAQAKGYISQLPCYNSIFNYFEMEMLTPYLQMLIEESSLPLASIERDFAVDSSGLSTGVYRTWRETKWDKEARKYGEDVTRINIQDWLKIHIMCGVKTNVVTSVEVSDCYASDTPYLKPLVEKTAQGFVMNEVSADRAYLSKDNLKTVVENAAMPFIPFKVNSRTNEKRHTALWRQMYHYFSYNTERFMAHYHKRSNVESTFHMIKAKFGDKLRSKTRKAQINEALCKILCHNICVLIQAMYELGLKPKFWNELT